MGRRRLREALTRALTGEDEEWDAGPKPRAAQWHELVFALGGSNGRRLRRIFLIQDHHLFSLSRPRSPEAIGVLKPLFSPGRRIAIPVMLYRLAQKSSFRVWCAPSLWTA